MLLYCSYYTTCCLVIGDLEMIVVDTCQLTQHAVNLTDLSDLEWKEKMIKTKQTKKQGIKVSSLQVDV